jgi:hypothetical protein
MLPMYNASDGFVVAAGLFAQTCMTQMAGVDFAAVKKNAAEQGISLDSIAIVYEGLSGRQVRTMRKLSLITSEGSKVMAKFPTDGQPLFPEKATGVICLAAD